MFALLFTVVAFGQTHYSAFEISQDKYGDSFIENINFIGSSVYPENLYKGEYTFLYKDGILDLQNTMYPTLRVYGTLTVHGDRFIYDDVLSNNTYVVDFYVEDDFFVMDNLKGYRIFMINLDYQKEK